MTNPQIQNDPIYSLPFLYKYGMIVSNNATTPNTKLDISAGQCRDSNDVMDIVFGTSAPEGAPLNGVGVAAPLTLNAATTGANGLDTGSLAASTVYAVYAIGDSRYYMTPAVILTLASNSAPLMPLGYDSYRLIGYAVTDASSHFLLGYYTGNGAALTFTYDAPQATSVTAGAATSYTAIDLSALVPPVNNLIVNVQSNFNANAAADTLKMQGANSTGDAILIIAPVAGSTAHTVTNSNVLAQLVSSAPKINYKVSSGSDAVAINVAGFSLTL